MTPAGRVTATGRIAAAGRRTGRVATAWGMTAAFFPYDQDADGDVDVADILKVSSHFGASGC